MKSHNSRLPTCPPNPAAFDGNHYAKDQSDMRGWFLEILHRHEVSIKEYMDQQNEAHREAVLRGLTSMEERMIGSVLPPTCGRACVNGKDAFVVVANTDGSTLTSNPTRDVRTELVPPHSQIVHESEAEETLCCVMSEKPQSPLTNSHSQSAFEKIQNDQKRAIERTSSRLDRAFEKARSRTKNFFEKTTQPASSTNLQWFANGPLDTIASVVIALSTCITFLHLEWEGCQNNKALGLGSCDPWLDNNPTNLFAVAEKIFNMVFVSELVIRISVLGRGFFYAKFNIFDAIVVLISTIDTYVLETLENSQGNNVALIRMLRYARMARTVRLVRQLKFFGPLRVLVSTILSSVASLWWSFIILGLAQLLAALLLCQSLASFIKDEAQEYEMRAWANQMYGSSSKSFYTMFEVTISGCWPNYVRPLVEKVNPLYAVAYLIYIVFVVFALIRIISALFIKDTLAQAASDVEVQVESAKEKRAQFEMKLIELFEHADKDGDGRLSYDEFSDVFEDPRVKAWCQSIEINIREIHDLFDLIDDGDGLITYKEFINSMARLKGVATSQDVVAILHDCHKIMVTCDRMHRMMVHATDSRLDALNVASP